MKLTAGLSLFRHHVGLVVLAEIPETMFTKQVWCVSTSETILSVWCVLLSMHPTGLILLDDGPL